MRLATVNELAFSISICAHITNCTRLFTISIDSSSELYGYGTKEQYLLFIEITSDTHELQLHGDQCHVCFYYSVRNTYGLCLFFLIVKFVFHWYSWKQ